MKLVHAPATEGEVQRNAPREGRFEFRRLLEGTVGSPDNFIFRITRLDSGFFSPRHCHNFDQIRYILEGATDFGPDGRLEAGMIGYFPEGTAYGPQTIPDTMVVMTLQFGGASGQGFLSADQVEQGAGELKDRGRFEKGHFITIDASGREHRKDAYQAVWEHVNGRAFVAPPRRYRQPIFIQPEHFAWRPVAGEPGVAKRHLGSFTERGTYLEQIRLDAGASTTLDPHGITFVEDGDGTIGTDAWGPHSAIQLDWDERAEVRATRATRLVRIGLPDLRDVAAQARSSSSSNARASIASILA